MKKFRQFLLTGLLLGLFIPFLSAQSDLIITAVYDGDLTGGTPKGVELYALNDIADLSAYAIGSANNGGGTDGVEFTFSGAAVAGQCLYAASEAINFEAWFGFAPDFNAGSSLSINGDDAIELFKDSIVVDVFGDINVDGNGELWEYVDGWAYRNSGTGPDGAVFTIGNWTFSGVAGLDGATTNAGASVPMPVCTYTVEAPQLTIANDFNAILDMGTSLAINAFINDVLPTGLDTVTIVSSPSNGTGVYDAAQSAIVYTPAGDFCGLDTIVYEICDLNGSCDQASIFIEVTCAAVYTPVMISEITGLDTAGVAISFGMAVEVTATVHCVDFNGGSAVEFFIHDGTDGIGIFSSNDFGYTVNAGDLVTIQGEVSQFNGLTQISPDTIILMPEPGILNAPTDVTVLDESTESEYVRINNVTFDPAEWTGSGSGFNLNCTDDLGNTFSVRIDNDVDLYSMPAPVGVLNMSGMGSQFDNSAPHDSGYQLLVCGSSDVEVVSPPDMIMINDDAVTMTVEMDSVLLDLFTNDVFPNLDSTDVALVSLPANGALNLIGYDLFYYPNPDFCGEDSFLYFGCDQNGCDTATVTITVECPLTYTPATIGEITMLDSAGVAVSIDQTFSITGTVYGVDLQGNDNVQFTINDGDGIGLFSSNSYGYVVNEGDQVTVWGTVGQFNGLTQISPDTIILLPDAGTLNVPMVVTALGEDTESELARIESVTFDPADWTGSGSGFNLDCEDAVGNTFSVRIDNDVDLYSMPSPTGVLNITGIGGQFDSSSPYDSGYQLLPRYMSDIEMVTGTEDVLNAQMKVYPNPAHDLLFLDMKAQADAVFVTNVLGQHVYKTTSPQQFIKLNVADWTPGLYQVTFVIGNDVVTRQLVIQ